MLSISILQFIYYNFLCGRVKRDKGTYIVPNRHTRIELHKNAKIILHGHLYLNENKYPHSRAECYLRVRDGGTLTVTGNVCMMYNSTLEVHKNASLSIGSCLFQSGAVIICAYKMSLGEECIYARMSYVSDSDHHRVLNEEGETRNYPRETVLGNNVWIGVKGTVLKGARIADGCVVGAGGIVGGKIKEHALMKNDLATTSSDIYWSMEGFGDWKHD